MMNRVKGATGATKNDHDEDDWKWMILMIESLKKTFKTWCRNCVVEWPKPGWLNLYSMKLIRILELLYDATLYDLFKYPFVSYDVDACKNGNTTFMISYLSCHTFFQSWCIHYSLAKSKRKWFSMHGKIVYFSTFHSVLKSLKMTQTENSDYVLLPLFCWFLLGVNCIFLPLFGGSVPLLRSSLRSQCCKLRLFEWFLQFVKYILDCHDI